MSVLDLVVYPHVFVSDVCPLDHSILTAQRRAFSRLLIPTRTQAALVFRLLPSLCPHDRTAEEERTLVGKVGDVAKDDVLVLVGAQRGGQLVRLVPDQGAADGELRFRAVGPRLVVEHRVALEPVLAEPLHDQRHVRLEVVRHVELGVVLVGVEDRGVEGHCGDVCGRIA